MAYIAPNSTIKLLSNVPLGKDYENTILFATAAAQETYFSGKATHTFTNVSFVKSDPGTLKLEIEAESAMLCNYMMYKNTSFGNKWFYAFIDSVEYVNNKNALIRFTLDVIQTWHFDYSLTDVFLERNHTSTDTMGSSLTPEPVDIGSYIEDGEETLLSEDYVVIIGSVDIDENTPVADRVAVTIPLIGLLPSTDPDNTNQTQGHTYQKVYSGYTYTAFLASDVAAIDSFLGYYSKKGKIDAIKTMYIFPKDPFGATSFSTGYVLPDNTTIDSKTGYVTGITQSGNNASTLNGYLPKNKKLYTYPYTYMEVDNGSGQQLELRYELFKTPAFPYYSVKYNLQQPVSVIFEPLDYNQTSYDSQNREVNHDFQLMLQNFPMCAWGVDSYAAWQAQNSINMPGIATGVVVGGVGDMLRSSLMAGITGIIGGGINALINSILGGYRAHKAPDQIRGNNSSGNGAVAQERMNFYVSRKSLMYDNAKRADDYFTMFGYNIGSLYHVTNQDDPRDHRPQYTYIKTVGMDINGTLPAEDARKINEIYDKGIRWWKVPANLGDYSVDNAPVS